MFSWIALTVAALAAFGILGIMLGIFRVRDVLHHLLAEVADLIPFIDDDEEEEDSLPLDDVDYDIDEDTNRLFVEIAEQLGDVEGLGDEIVDERDG